MARRVVLIADTDSDSFGAYGPLLGFLSDAGAATELFSDGAAGLRSALSGGTDLLVVDLDAPSLGGIPTIEGIGQIASRIPTLLLSADSGKARRMWAVSAGVMTYATKPVDGAALAGFVAKMFNGE